jgi:lipopolysaccharide biosynthesis glycosyltransferase
MNRKKILFYPNWFDETMTRGIKIGSSSPWYCGWFSPSPRRRHVNYVCDRERVCLLYFLLLFGTFCLYYILLYNGGGIYAHKQVNWQLVTNSNNNNDNNNDSATASLATGKQEITLLYCSSADAGYLRGTAASICAAAHHLDVSSYGLLTVYVAVPVPDFLIARRYFSRFHHYPDYVQIKVVAFKPQPAYQAYRIRFPPGFEYLNSSSVWCRLHAAELLPESVNKFIYLDSDTLPVDDLGELWQFYQPATSGQALAAVETCDVHFHTAGLKMMTLRNEGYSLHSCTINNGVFAGSATLWRENEFIEKFHTLAERAVSERLMPGLEDQHIMALFGAAHGLLSLPKRWNVMVGSSIPTSGGGIQQQGVAGFEQRLAADVAAAAILHWTGPRKPWQRNSSAPFQHIWKPWARVCTVPR